MIEWRVSLHEPGCGHGRLCCWLLLTSVFQFALEEDTLGPDWIQWGLCSHDLRIINPIIQSELPGFLEVMKWLFSAGVFTNGKLLRHATPPQISSMSPWCKWSLYAAVLEEKNWKLWNLSLIQINFSFHRQVKGKSERERGLPSVTWLDLMKWAQSRESGLWALPTTDASACAMATVPQNCLRS